MSPELEFLARTQLDPLDPGIRLREEPDSAGLPPAHPAFGKRLRYCEDGPGGLGKRLAESSQSLASRPDASS